MAKVWTRDEIMGKIRTDEVWVARAIVALVERDMIDRRHHGRMFDRLAEQIEDAVAGNEDDLRWYEGILGAQQEEAAVEALH